MATTYFERKEQEKKALDDLDVNALLEGLTEEELELLGQELIDPDDPMIPASDRCQYKTDKKPTGPYNRKHLLDFIEKKAMEEKDWEEARPYTKETRGKVYKPKEVESTKADPDSVVETEWDEALEKATEEELVDLAAILGFHGMLNQVQYHQAFVEGEGVGGKSGFQGIAKGEALKLYKDDPPNDTDFDSSLERVQNNDVELTELNLNNIKNISIERLIELSQALADNTSLQKLHMSNTRATGKVAKCIAESLRKNTTLEVLDLESNYIPGEAVVQLMESINVNQTLKEFRVANQRPAVLGNRVEMKITNLLKENETLQKLGIFLSVADARVRCAEYLQRNNDSGRQHRKN